MQVIQFYNGGFTWVNCRLTIIDDSLCNNIGLHLLVPIVEISIPRTRPLSLDGWSVEIIVSFKGQDQSCIIALERMNPLVRNRYKNHKSVMGYLCSC